jgi:hypothetical protein
MRQSNVAKGLAIFVAAAACLWLFIVPDAAGRCEAQCFVGMVGLLVTGAVMIANLAVAGSILIPGAQQYVKRSGAAVAALWGLCFALAYSEASAPTCATSCPQSTFDAVFALALLIADVVLVGTIFVGASSLARRLRSSGGNRVSFSRLKGWAVLGWGLLAFGDFVEAVRDGGGLSWLVFLGTTALGIWLATIQPASEVPNRLP